MFWLKLTVFSLKNSIENLEIDNFWLKSTHFDPNLIFKFSYMRLNCDGGEFYYDGESIGDTFDFECSIAKVKISKIFTVFLVLDFLEFYASFQNIFSSLLTKFTKIFFCCHCPEFNHYTTNFEHFYTWPSSFRMSLNRHVLWK